MRVEAHNCHCGEYGNEYLLSFNPYKSIYLCDVHAIDNGFCFIYQERGAILNNDGKCCLCEERFPDKDTKEDK